MSVAHALKKKKGTEREREKEREKKKVEEADSVMREERTGRKSGGTVCLATLATSCSGG